MQLCASLRRDRKMSFLRALPALVTPRRPMSVVRGVKLVAFALCGLLRCGLSARQQFRFDYP
eukprot:496462-Lingulodinium_polyedra.AAC.1